MTEPIPVRVRDCACPGDPHPDGDVVYLRPHLNIDGGEAAEADLIESMADERELKRRWLRTFVKHGAVSWNLTDAEGEPVPFDVDAILDDWTLARPVADKAADLYTQSVIAPFVTKPGARSPTGQTAPTTSATRGQTRKSSASR
jgi:hypothetical protein